ncbi:hypothetical protein J2X06_000034 [Lysobacter niastensis]|uniref:Uncharacterized protein n=1 Tax=Lysobacter niastensis TaxID=380629 RepID=A0ABU1W674_9GAMM|nr:hypothetical protein [Lysobacter niastensis]MDR7132850.1 hypothetical protein [Lysobacter niastensis]
MAHNPYSAPTSAVPILATAKRPATVVIAIWSFAGSYAVGLLNLLVKIGLPRSAPGVAGMIIGASIAGGFLVAIYLRKNWTRWIMVILMAFAVVMTPGRFSSMAELSDRLIFAAQGILQLAATILLLLPVSRRWYRPNNSFQAEGASRLGSFRR